MRINNKKIQPRKNLEPMCMDNTNNQSKGQ